MGTERAERTYFTYHDWLSSDEDGRYELLDGVPTLLATPSTKHQAIISFLTTEFNMHVRALVLHKYSHNFQFNTFSNLEPKK